MMYAKAERLISNSDILPAPRASVSFKSVSITAGYHIKTIKENSMWLQKLQRLENTFPTAGAYSYGRFRATATVDTLSQRYQSFFEQNRYNK